MVSVAKVSLLLLAVIGGGASSFGDAVSELVADAFGSSSADVVESRTGVEGADLVAGYAVDGSFTDRRAFVFVLAREPDGSIGKVRSPVFAANPGAAGFGLEAIEFTSADRFHLQFNGHSTCGGFTRLFRFAKRGGIWVLSGHDYTGCECGEGDEAVCDSRSEVSANFLTGKLTRREFGNNRLISDRSELRTYHAVPIETFSVEMDGLEWY
jgi:hypothetical protein